MAIRLWSYAPKTSLPLGTFPDSSLCLPLFQSRLHSVVLARWGCHGAPPQTGAHSDLVLPSRPGDQDPPHPSLIQHPHVVGLVCGQVDPRATSRTSDFLPCYHIPKTWLRTAHSSCRGMTKPLWTLLTKTFHYPYHNMTMTWFIPKCFR